MGDFNGIRSRLNELDAKIELVTDHLGAKFPVFKRQRIMPTAISSQPVPLERGADGVIHVKGSRVTIETLIASFADGATAEEIAQQYPTLDLAVVYGVISYYLQHTAELETYLRERHQTAATVRRENERRFDPRGVRDRLLARRAG